MRIPSLFFYLALTTVVHADVCTVARQGRMSLAMLEQVSRNEFDELACGERSQGSPTGAAAAACEDLHAYSCAQQVVRDPLTSSYSEEARFFEVEAEYRRSILQSMGAKFDEVITSDRYLAAKLSAVTAAGVTSSDVHLCLYEFFAKRSSILPINDSSKCADLKRVPAWESFSKDYKIEDIGEWMDRALSDTILRSRKHQTLTQVIFPQAKAMMMRLMDAQAAANPSLTESYTQMRGEIERAVLVEPEPYQVNAVAQMYASRDGSVFCNHAAIVKGNYADIAHGVIHELAHLIDPCVGVVSIRSGTQPEFPLRNLLSCLKSETGLMMGNETERGFDCQNAGESFADILATALLPHLLPIIYGDTLKTHDDYAQAYAGIGRSFKAFCSPVSDESHPSWNSRINMLVASNPIMRSQLGCPQLSVPGSSCFQLLSSPCP